MKTKLSLVFLLHFYALVNQTVQEQDFRGRRLINSENRTANFTLKEIMPSLNTEHNSTGFTPLPTVSSTTEVQVTSSNFSSSYEAVHKKWEHFYVSSKKLIDDFVKDMIPKLLKIVSKVKLSNRCMTTLIKVAAGLQGMRTWAVRLVDSMSKIPSGIFDGTMSDMGDFDECVNIVHTSFRKKRKSVIRGQYCSLEIGMDLPDRPKHVILNQHPLDFSNFTGNESAFRDLARLSEYFYDDKLLLALCIPHTCAKDDIQHFLDYALSSVPMTAEITGCYQKEPLRVNNEQIAVLCVIGVFITLALVGTIYSTCFSNMMQSSKKHAQKKIYGFLSAFDINENFRRLWSSKRKEEHLSCLDGIRVLTMLWLLISHMILTHARSATGRAIEGKNLVAYHSFQILINGFIGADTFFFIGGLLMFYVNCLRIEKNKGKLDLSRYFFHRLWRIMPPMWILLGMIFLLPMMGSGPLWHKIIDPKLENCRQNWWSVVSGINSWFQKEDMCLEDMWYVSNDLHYFILVPLILVLLYKSPVIGMGFILFLAVSATAAVAFLTMANDYVPVIVYLQPDRRSTNTMLSNIQYRFYGHLVAYCIGIVVGYLLLKYPRRHIPRFYQIIGWLVAIGTSSLIVFSPYEWNLGHFPEQSVSVAYASLHRAAWSLLVAWITYMCATGRGGCINTMLSWKSWRPLSNLSYAVYLVHFPYLWLRNGYRRERISFSIYEMLNEVFAVAAMSGFIAVAFHLLFIAPLPNLEALIFQEKVSTPILPPSEQTDIFEKKLNKKVKPDEKNNVTVTSIEIIHT